MLVDVDDSDDEAPCLIPAGDEVPTLVSGSEDDTPNIPVTIITGQYWLTEVFYWPVVRVIKLF